MTNPNSVSRTDIEEITTRNETARRMIAGFAVEMPALSGFWRHLDAALADTATLSGQLARLNAELAAIRLDTANLLAAMQAAIAAHADGETDPLWYIRDELNARQTRPQGHGRVS